MTYIVAYSAEEKDSTSYWPAQFSWSTLKKWEQELGPISYSSQYKGSPIDSSGNYLKADYLHYYQFNKLPDRFDKTIMFVDPATSLKESADYFAVAVGASHNKLIYLLDLYRNHEPLHDQINTIVTLYNKWHPQDIIVETTGQQLYLVQGLEYNTKLHIIGSRPKSSKEVKFESASVYFNKGDVLIPGYQDEFSIWHPASKFQVFYDEWVGFPKSKNDDTLDAVCGVVDNLLTIHSASVVMEPYNTQEVIDRVSKQLELTDLEKQQLEQYINNKHSIRRHNFGLRNII